MRMSCNGCRVLRKGCSDDCTIRPCLQWIKSPEAQGNATVFLAKFYGRAGLLNLINAGPDKHRPAIFRSLLYEACGRIVNPIYGSVGLLWSGNRQLCQSAVEAVLKGLPIVQIPSEKASDISMPPLKSFDIRHVTKNAAKLNVSKLSQTPFKLSSTGGCDKHVNRLRRPQREKSHHESGGGTTTTTSTTSGSMISAETVQPSTPEPRTTSLDHEVGLDLTLGLGFSSSQTANKHSSPSSCSPDQAKLPSERCMVDNLALF